MPAPLAIALANLCDERTPKVGQDPSHDFFERNDHVGPDEHEQLQDVDDARRARSGFSVRPALEGYGVATTEFRHGSSL